MTDTNYKPISYSPKQALENDLQNTEFKKAWESLEDEFTALDALLSARRRACMHDSGAGAAVMGVSQPSLARVEASLGSHKHSLSLEMLRKYAAAVNCKFEFRLVPQ